MSILTGSGWVAKLLNSHPERIRTELAVHKHVFNILLWELQQHGIGPSKHIMLKEQLAIFLYTSVTGLSIRHVGEHFQRSNGMISKPVNAEECYNLHHAQLGNVIEQIIGVIKRRFRILIMPPEYGMDVQARIPPALCCIHNIIRMYDPLELDDIEGFISPPPPDESEEVIGVIANGITTTAERLWMLERWGAIAQNIWNSYIAKRV
ncbi:hypothetical protein M404DRAFT_21335 [Pisolithus tinctorius Marx 270]|uniref:DUF8040 domain-containing protein n=1 Tax=Pisolithus tinctorius Marx 270 TaxID=870435 RepID=A0A0C3JMJ8_PISTI|nr:hypothetical protein M404DRAFT_21335 [Pisolithus tinctorius Marx 270]